MLPSLSRIAFAAVLLTTSLGGCSLVLDADEPQCKTDGDCAKRGAAEAICVASLCVLPGAGGAAGSAGAGGGTGGAGGEAGGEAGAAGAPLEPPWTCIGTIPTPVGTTPKIHVKLPLVDFISAEPRPNVSIRVCGQLDPVCAAASNPSFVTGADGIATLEIETQPTVFNGYFKIDGTPDVSPSLIFAQPLTVIEGTTLSPVRTFVLAQYRALVEAGGNVWNDQRGHIFVQARNCDGATAEGVTYAIPKLEADTVRVFLRAGAPDRNAPDTDATGIGGFIMAGTGFHTVTGTLSKTGTVVNERRVRVEAGTFTYTVMSPSP